MLTPKRPCLTTPRLCLRALTAADEQPMIRLLTHPQVTETYMVPEFAAPQEAVKLFRRIRQLSLDENRFVYGIYVQERLIGLINEVGKDEASVELGYALHPEDHGKGYATEALAAAMEELFRMGYLTVKAGAFEENRASLRVMEKCGMTPTGQTEEIEYRGRTHRCVGYEISRESHKTKQ